MTSDESLENNDKFKIEIEIDELYYLLNEKENTALIKQGTKTNTRIFIPRSIEYEGKTFIITSIANNSFTFFNNLLFIKFAQDSMIKFIRKAAFSWSSIISISIPSSVTHIGKEAFCECCNLKNIIFQSDSKLQQIGDFAFADTLIEHITLPSTVSELKEKWLFSTPHLKKVTIMPNNKFYKNYENDNRIVVGKSDINNNEYDSLIFVGRGVKTFTIPSSIKIISPHSFSKSKIEKVFISHQVKKIGMSAFHSCFKLKNIEIPENSELQTIGEYAFYDSSIEKIFIPSQITLICERTFEYCKNLQQIEFHKNSQI